MYIYADCAATVPVLPASLDAFVRASAEFANPSSAHTPGHRAAKLLADARADCARILGCRASELIFTSGATESLNAVISSFSSGHIVTTAIEHPALSRAVDAFCRRGGQVTRVDADPSGQIDPDAVCRAIRPDTVLIAVMSANNETGVLQPVCEIGALARARGIRFLTDAVQLPDTVRPDLSCADYLALSGHKFGAVRGAGLLFVRAGAPLVPWMHGGGQESGFRSGTQNVGAACSLAAALRDAASRWGNDAALAAHRDRFEKTVLDALPDTVVRGSGAPRLAGFSEMTFSVGAEALLSLLDLWGVGASAASACSTNDPHPSATLLSMGVGADEARRTVRFSFSHRNTDADFDLAADAVIRAVQKLRKLIP